ncbi:MAG TPA: response regulator transcription factor [Rhodocyclaceae bacterium]|nr:response regulator transcription factor [Rhodocyclaceae bacterium]
MRVLVVEDDRLVAGTIVLGLSRAGYTADHVSSAEMADSALRHEQFDLAIVDIGLPGADGLELLGRIRKRGDTIPALILTARDSLAERVSGLDAGADDYLVKPFHVAELLARIRALVRRSKSIASSELIHGGLCLNLARHTAELNGRTLDVTPREWAVLEALLLNVPNVLTKAALVQKLGGWKQDLTPNAIEVLVSRLRGKLEPGGMHIRTVRGIGYRLDEVAA